MTDSPFSLKDAANLIQVREDLQGRVDGLQAEIRRINLKLTAGLRLDVEADPVAVPDGKGQHWIVSLDLFDQLKVTSTASLEPDWLCKPIARDPSGLVGPSIDPSQRPSPTIFCP